jgi:hypothetical protein
VRTVILKTSEGELTLRVMDGVGAEGAVGHAVEALVVAGLLEGHRRASVMAQARLRCLEGGVLWTTSAESKS